MIAQLTQMIIAGIKSNGQINKSIVLHDTVLFRKTTKNSLEVDRY